MKYIAKIKIIDPVAVKAKMTSLGDTTYDNLACFCECQEIGFTGENLLYCRYGLTFPYIQLNIDDQVLIEPTIDTEQRWFYTGIVDCTGGITATTNLKMKIPMAGFDLIVDNGVLKIGSSGASESFLFGDVFNTWLATFINTTFNTHTHISSAPTLPSSPPTPTGVMPTGHLSTKIKGE